MAKVLIGNFKGPQGVQGPKGDTGAQGPTGATGATGAKGEKGDTGAQGPVGAAGAAGQRGSLWYTGTAVTGTSTTAAVFAGTGIANALVGDMYLNTSTSGTYCCTVAGAASTAKWTYTGSIKGQKGDAPALTNNLLATVAGTALDAAQGKVLDDKITEVNRKLTWEPFALISGLAAFKRDNDIYVTGDFVANDTGWVNICNMPSGTYPKDYNARSVGVRDSTNTACLISTDTSGLLRAFITTTGSYYFDIFYKV